MPATSAFKGVTEIKEKTGELLLSHILFMKGSHLWIC